MERIALCGKLRIFTEGAAGNVLTQGKTSLLGVDVDGDVLDGLGEARVVLELRFDLLEQVETKLQNDPGFAQTIKDITININSKK